MSDVIKICAAALIAAVCGALLREFGWRGGVAFSAVALAVFVGVFSDGISEIASKTLSVSESYGVGKIAKEVLKLIGVSYIFGISSDVCTELGEKTLANTLVAVGRVEIFLIVMPYFLEIVKQAASLVG